MRMSAQALIEVARRTREASSTRRRSTADLARPSASPRQDVVVAGPGGVVFIGHYALVRRSCNAGRSNTCLMSGALQKLSGLPGHHAGARWPK